MRTSIVIVNWNSGEQLLDCVNSIFKYGMDYADKIIVVDNNSTDDSISYLPKNEEKLDVILSDTNLGFGKACNLGASNLKSDFILFLNPDAKLLEDTLRKTMEFMTSQFAKDKKIAVCGVRLNNEVGLVQKCCTYFPSLITYFGHSTGLSKLFPKKFPYIFMHDFDHLSSREVNHCIGAYYFMRRDVFEELEGFDERFFVYLEDLDLSLRISNAGWKVYYYSEATAFHKGGGTSEKVKALRLFYSLQSRITYSFKHFSKVDALWVVFLTMFVEPFSRLIFAISHFSKQETKDTLLGYQMLWGELPAIIKKGFKND
ncbi:glycosyltransferase family 2 protein [Pectobacterium peruviense]|uniref:glycosyltransferase family 2 protein n=1 Tax=Pectobacterium peruviense TaxID=2066479 RepID=UPI001CB91E69|nr:glycosyltransferase family 2 protein [Pectobacterium peruviense]